MRTFSFYNFLLQSRIYTIIDTVLMFVLSYFNESAGLSMLLIAVKLRNFSISRIFLNLLINLEQACRIQYAVISLKSTASQVLKKREDLRFSLFSEIVTIGTYVRATSLLYKLELKKLETSTYLSLNADLNVLSYISLELTVRVMTFSNGLFSKIRILCRVRRTRII